MKIFIYWNLDTDGDFSLKNYNEFDGIYDGSDGYCGYKIFEFEDRYKCKYEAKRFLSKMLCEIHVSYTHYWVIEKIYEIFNSAIMFITEYDINDANSNYIEYMDGNYSDSYISITIK